MSRTSAAACQPVCDNLLTASTSPIDPVRHTLCTRVDRKTATLSTCGDCAMRWLNAAAIRRALTRSHDWLLFVGDSDTRGFVAALLQILAVAAAGSLDAAAKQRALWLGAPEEGRTFSADDQRLRADDDAMRRCLIDWHYSPTGALQNSRTVHCKKSITWAYGTKKMPERVPYVVFGQDYNLTTPRSAGDSSADAGAHQERGLRVTFVGTGHEDQTHATITGIARHLSQRQARPSALYVGVGSWYNLTTKHLDDDGSKTAGRLAKMSDAIEQLRNVVQPRSAPIFGTTRTMNGEGVERATIYACMLLTLCPLLIHSAWLL